jgi:hypothetical protein
MSAERTACECVAPAYTFSCLANKSLFSLCRNNIFMCEMNALLDIHCGATPAKGKHAVVCVLSEALEPTDSWVATDSACEAL